MGKRATIFATALLWGTTALAQGVPTVDGGLIIRNEASNVHRESDLATQRETLSVQEQLAEIERQQLEVLQQILDAQTSIGGQGIPAMVEGLEDGNAPEQSADVVFNPEDSNPAGAQMFGDAAQNVEELIIQVAAETHGLSGVSQAGFSVREWRFMLQALIWQESRFSIGARSPVGAFGLTQIMPATAGDLGILPDYYDSPYLQVKGGARYLAQMLAMFDGNIINGLAAYNAGPGNVQKYGGVPPFEETRHYVQVIPAKYNEYLALGGGGDAVGTIDPALMANSNLSFAGANASFYGNGSMATVQASAARLRDIVQQIGRTADVQEAMALNSYARAEVARLVANLTRLRAARNRTASAHTVALAAERQREQQYMNFDMEELD
ncbi:MAG: lytic transglycosylase domain-containing protein [Rhodobiaceae bacterium]|uniref:Soluble lytic murein transglycosylase n=1 Tax=Phaeobacter piscinae TaxID=1580596 RepID=A0ABN5DW42_9RHOB|nr:MULTISPECIES: lytic transglycosylase domain-containing protein [Rhodobacterales]ATG37959.1 Soluble lytic murein transglycosylase [Phaeobacter piscinae]AUQ88480.1 Soluble lytic murein transglycosylase [Phaeobacter piscinae]MCE8000987.1 lytic transglycosylase domain-containing protein [Rhodobiaceae bacterium]